MVDYLYTSLSTGYKVFITIPGVVTHKVPFNVDPSFYGEYDFLAHGLHYITASTPFLEWNKENQVCMYEIFSIKKLVIRPRAVWIKETGPGGAQCVELVLRWQFCVHGSICHEKYI